MGKSEEREILQEHQPVNIGIYIIKVTVIVSVTDICLY